MAYVERSVVYTKVVMGGITHDSDGVDLQLKYRKGSEEARELIVSVMCGGKEVLKDVSKNVEDIEVGTETILEFMSRYTEVPEPADIPARTIIDVSNDVRDIDVDPTYPLVVVAIGSIYSMGKIIDPVTNNVLDYITPRSFSEERYGMDVLVVRARAKTKVRVDCREIPWCMVASVRAEDLDNARFSCTATIRESLGSGKEYVYNVPFVGYIMTVSPMASVAEVEEYAWGA